jgi:hypothetical protein
MANLLKCGGCGAAMTIRTASGRADTLRCYKHCGGAAGSYVSAVEERLIGLLTHYLTEHAFPFQYTNEEKNETAEGSVLAHSLKSWENRKKELKKQRNSLYDLLEQGVYDRDTFLERSKTLTENLQLVESRIEAVRIRLAGQTPNAGRIFPPFQNMEEFIRLVYRNLDAKNRNDFLKEIIGSVIYIKPKGAKKDGFSLEILLNN